MNGKTIKVLVVDDSRVSRELLKHVLESDPLIEVVAMVESGDAALKWLENHSCHVVTMDIHMPVLNGFEVTQRIMAIRPTPTIIISSGYTQTDEKMAFDAMEAGALAILEKPAGLGDQLYHKKVKEIVETIKMVSSIKVVRRTTFHHSSQQQKVSIEKEIKKEFRAVAIGASLGGPLAVAQILSELQADFPMPVFVVQHIAAGFTDGFIKWLQERSKLKILSAQDGIATAGNVYVARDGCQMYVNKGNFISLESSEHIQPSINTLFKSISQAYGPNAIGILLTGMGRDGAEGLLAMKQKGALTIVQDKESSLVFGMPKEAIQLGAATKILPLNAIASALNVIAFSSQSQGDTSE